ncbi:MAG: hypothetical protein CVU97_04080 [Firmicutes bacterium HGW-Firmicutes-21]|nr:MAG: hypothetical protein CVU97_04080 [Firmicutes bacterium HGW-Firmicutes-21]
MYSVFKRFGKKRSDLPAYLDEKWNFEYFKFCKWIWSFPKKQKNTIIDLHMKYPEKPFLIIKSRKEMRKLLDKLKQET